MSAPRSTTIRFDSHHIDALRQFADTATNHTSPGGATATVTDGPARTAAPVEQSGTGRTLILRHTYAGGTILLGTDRGDHIAETFHAASRRGSHPGGWKWSGRIDNDTTAPGAWYIPRTRDHPGNRDTVDRIAASARALRSAGFAVQVEIDDTALDPSGRRWLDIHADTLGRSSRSHPDQPAAAIGNGSRDHTGQPADRTVYEVRARSANLVRQVFAATGTASAQPQTSASAASTTAASNEVDGEEMDRGAAPEL